MGNHFRLLNPAGGPDKLLPEGARKIPANQKEWSEDKVCDLGGDSYPKKQKKKKNPNPKTNKKKPKKNHIAPAYQKVVCDLLVPRVSGMRFLV